MLVPSKTLKSDTTPEGVGRGLIWRVEGVPATKRVRCCGGRRRSSDNAVAKETLIEKSSTLMDWETILLEILKVSNMEGRWEHWKTKTGSDLSDCE